eukprot:Blabericola_migrator_1__9887@NODE_544_length_7726_cov_166_284763_g411_i0_p2_GENE_NODE_544_length_7726_cov_166_284763_g411_i0NODE_544_length_7726_cov_166_284763_g411_i0_p2_ORF_typecomplete_len831_score143_30Bromodomain/PF00439_25/1_5e18Bromodomain/PF00439_25/1_1e04TBX/PF12598_8/16TBX/PF12598_8/12_NODE_544_length_7726_cov_166_284763_g411_i039746466
MGDLILDRATHGQNCALGELCLSEDELHRINALIAAAGFRFIPAVKTSTTASSVVKPPLKRTTRSSVQPPALKDTPKPSKVVSPSAKRKVNARRASSAPAEDSSSDVMVERAPLKKRKKEETTVEIKPAVVRAASPPPQVVVELPTLTTVPLIVETPKQPPIIDIKGDGRAAWEAACTHVSQLLESNPLAKHFLQPVNPEADGLPEYFEKVQNPMDLHTVRQKLEGKLYTHPFRWQHDIRSIFFNAFLYFDEGSPIWRCAAELAVTFENLCKENLSVNPYAVYRVELPKPEPPPATPVKPTPVESVAPAPAATPPTPPATAPHEEGGDTITLDTAQLKALLLQAKEKGITDISPPGSTAGGGISPAPSAAPLKAPPLQTSPPTKGPRGRPPPPKGVRFRDGLGVVYTAECMGTPFEKEIVKNPPVSALPPPCPIPAAQVTDSKSPIIPTVAQKKSTLSRFKELDVTYRKAVLDLVKNELGIHSLLCALDSRYVPEVDVLPLLKQRQFFMYMKALVTQQKLAQDTQHLPATLPRILNWNCDYNQEPPPQPIKRKIFPDKTVSPVDASPWVVSNTATNLKKGKSSLSDGTSSSSEPESSDGSADSDDSSSASSVFRKPPETPAKPQPVRPVAEKKPVAARPVMMTPSPYMPYMGSLAPPGHMQARPPTTMAPPTLQPKLGGRFQVPRQPFGAHPMHFAQPMPAYTLPPRPMPIATPQSAMLPPPGLQRQMTVPSADLYKPPPMTAAVRPRLNLWRLGGQGQGVPMNATSPTAWSMAGSNAAVPSTTDPHINGGTCWGEWKTKVLQETFLSQTRNVGVASERESRAEKADAEV